MSSLRTNTSPAPAASALADRGTQPRLCDAPARSRQTRWTLAGAGAAVAIAALAASLVPVSTASATWPAETSDQRNSTSVAANPTGLGSWVQLDHYSESTSNYNHRLGSTLTLDGAPEYKGKDAAGVIVANPVGSGYWIVTYDGMVSRRGTAADICADLEDCTGYRYGNRHKDTNLHTVVAAAATPTGLGLWVVDRTGAVWVAGDAESYGNVKDRTRNDKIATGMFATLGGRGYAIVMQDGEVLTFGDAPNFGSGGSNGYRVVGIAPSTSPTGRVTGYWVVNSHGTVTAFGAAPHLGNDHGGQRVVGIAALPGNRGYETVGWTGATEKMTATPPRWIEISTGGYYLRATSTAAGTQIHGTRDHGTDYSLWREVKDGDGYRLVNSMSGLCLDTDTGLVTQKPCSGVSTQMFTIEKESPGRYVVKTTTGGLEYHPEAGYMRAVAVSRPALVVWDVAPVITGAVTLVDHEGLALDVEGESTTPGAHVIGWPETGRPNQGWQVQLTAPGGYRLKNQQSSLCLEDDGALLVQQPCNGSLEQSFEATRRGNRVTLQTVNGYLTLDQGPGEAPRAVMNPHVDQATHWTVKYR